MKKTIKLNKDQSITLSNNISWTMEYMDQFGHDIIPDLMPVLSAVSNFFAGMALAASENGETLNYKDAVKIFARLAGSSTITDALIDLAGFRFVDLVNITWAMAKAADENIPEPKIWVRQFEVFPQDVILPEVFNMAMTGMVSSKNVKRLQKTVKTLGPSGSGSTTSSSQASKEG